MTPDEARKELVSVMDWGMAPATSVSAVIEKLLSAWGAAVGLPAFVSTTFANIKGAPPRTFRQFGSFGCFRPGRSTVWEGVRECLCASKAMDMRTFCFRVVGSQSQRPLCDPYCSNIGPILVLRISGVHCRLSHERSVAMRTSPSCCFLSGFTVFLIVAVCTTSPVLFAADTGNAGYRLTTLNTLGKDAPGGGTLVNDFEPSAITSSGYILFGADLSSGGEGVFLGRKSDLSAIARSGLAAPGGGMYRSRPASGTAVDAAFMR
jgi:hypothetical protein